MRRLAIYSGVLSFFFLFEAFSQDASVLNEGRWPQGVLVQQLVLQGSSFERSRLENLFSRVVNAESEEFPIIKVDVFSDAKAASESCKCRLDAVYSW
jgi:hypothetical protein